MPLGFAPDERFVEAARVLLRDHPAIDIHAHPGRTFVRDATGLSIALRLFALRGSFEDSALEDMRTGQMCGGSFALVSDFDLLDLKGEGLVARREFAPGEARSSYQKQLANLLAVAASNHGTLVSEPEDFENARKTGSIAMLLTVEGADFLAGDLRNVAAAAADGIRSITLVHYHPNEVGDIQTAPAVRGGLTPFGAELIGEMARVGLVVDLAHAAPAVFAKALEMSERPMLCSHTQLQGHGATHPRFIDESLARALAEKGGVVGAWPVSMGMASLRDFVDRIIDMAHVLGPDHVALGTDMDANPKPVLGSYRQMPLLVSELLKRGYGDDNAVKFIGGNFLRVFAAVRAGKHPDGPRILATP